MFTHILHDSIKSSEIDNLVVGDIYSKEELMRYANFHSTYEFVMPFF